MEFNFLRNSVADNKSHKYTLYGDEERITFSRFLQLLANNKSFRLFFIDLLSEVTFRAYHWETPPITINTAERLFEFVVSHSPGIDLPPDPGPFRQYFHPDKQVAVFDNLGGDAKLIAPTPPGGQQLNYSHIGVFTEHAPLEQQETFWETVGKITIDNISDRPLWLNTAGGGVAWLHVRLDSRPKYYRHTPYRSTES
ncbi:MAG: DUF6940 family protein [Bacteroidota bacterium]